MKRKAAQMFSEDAKGDGQTLCKNQERFDLLQSNAQMRIDMANLQEEMKNLTADLTAKLETLLIRSDTYVKTDQNYRAIRHRFLETFRRDRNMDRDQARIKHGNAVAHYGDAVADAFLYVDGSDKRNDISIMAMIYGFVPNTILLLNEHQQHETIGILNKHATLVVDTESAIPIPQYLTNAFLEFRAIVESELEDIKLGKARSPAWETARDKYTSLLEKHQEELRQNQEK